MSANPSPQQVQPQLPDLPASAVPLVSTPLRRAITPPNLLKRREPDGPSSDAPPRDEDDPATTSSRPNPFDALPSATHVKPADDDTSLPPPAKRPALARPAAARKPAGWDGVAESSQFSAYMAAKNGKLRAQFAAERDAHATSAGTCDDATGARDDAGTVLQGVTVWVDGLTTPPRTTIRSMMLAHGGAFETYLTDRVTHVVADNLAAATQRRLAPLTRRPRALRVVRAAWLQTCVDEGRRVPEQDFPVPGMTDPTQKSVASFFGAGKRKKGATGTARR